ncbi:hypothetical protein HPB49_023488 [Dermacentor silvarum]|uniref:Uncharacterized protein n=1 Tax=Dermacentor silvarum TaxID=543639 RepID=A0ACB8DL54_DERSI|nr:hypothetical protein HPB49_023488 [Dermacentor silvarum]
MVPRHWRQGQQKHKHGFHQEGMYGRASIGRARGGYRRLVSTTGTHMVTLQTPECPQRRHVNQLRPRLETESSPSKHSKARTNVEAQENPQRTEVPHDIKTVIATDNLTKVYGYKPALNGVNLKVYESRITVLLGHNGAGKTTMMSILTGMQAPTSGAATVCGFNVASQRHQLKGGRQDMVTKSIQATLRVVGLEDKAYSMPSELSGGMKRRLSIAMTLVSDPEILILDEPTAGMDPETRRLVWDTLQNVGKKKALLLSSHDMEEADAIADQIIIMASGVVVCSGSTAFLKKACGVGYKVTFAKVANAFKLNEVMNIVRNAAPAAIVDDDKKEEVSIALGTLDNKAFPAMFRTLESSLGRLGIASVGVTVASMKDVYLKYVSVHFI